MKAAILVAQDVQDEEFLYPYYRLQEAGFELDVVLSPYKDNLKPTGKYGIPIKWNILSIDAQYHEYDLIIIPGGWAPEILRMDINIIRLIYKHFIDNKIIGAICHGPQVLLSMQCRFKNLSIKKMTGYIGICHDVINAGYEYVCSSVVKDENIITANHYNANPEFLKTILKEFNL